MAETLVHRTIRCGTGSAIRIALFCVLCAASVATASAAALLDAAESGNTAAALAEIESGSDVNLRGGDGSTALMWAAYNGDIELAEALIAAGADVQAKNEFGTTALTEAAIIGSAPIISALLNAGADPDSRNPEGETPLMAVARTGNLEAAKALLEAGADVNAREFWGGQSAIMWAAARSQPAMIELLAGHGADIDARGLIRQWARKIITEPRPKDLNKGGFTPLLYAAREGCIDCARALLEHGADPNLADPERVTPLVMAILNMHFDFAAYMIEAGADVDKWDLFGRSPLYMAADTNTLPVMGNGAMVVLPSDDQHSALDIARMLLEAGADPNLRLKRRPPYRNVPQDRGGDTILAQGATPLLRAARAGDAPLVRLLLEHGALVDLPSKEGVTPLMAAAGVEFGLRVTRGRNRTEAGVLETLQLLVDAGADVNARMVRGPQTRVFQNAAQRAQGYTYADRGRQVPGPDAMPHRAAIHGAARMGSDSIIRFLASNGADLELQDADGLTPHDLAAGKYSENFRSAAAEPLEETMALLESLIAAR
ncbi:MAG: ankyrin repeat domain-containing protein [Gammaproteobacteria bacterium]|jgi:ankyrin repeat protein